MAKLTNKNNTNKHKNKKEAIPDAKLPRPPPLRKHPESHQNDGNTGSRA